MKVARAFALHGQNTISEHGTVNISSHKTMIIVKWAQPLENGYVIATFRYVKKLRE
jgi:hypothetical protein